MDILIIIHQDIIEDTVEDIMEDIPDITNYKTFFYHTY